MNAGVNAGARRRWRVLAAAVVLVAPLGVAVDGAWATHGLPGPTTFTYAGAVTQSYTVPTEATGVIIEAWGAEGAPAAGGAGLGGYVRVRQEISGGVTLLARVAGQGSGASGGWPGGGNSGTGGGGGGASRVLVGTSSEAVTLVAAGGGGGGGGAGTGTAAAGGDAGGAAGSDGGPGWNADGGQGATTTDGGSGGATGLGPRGGDGSQTAGGTGLVAGGGGGAGWFGGGGGGGVAGGAGAGGGGGSSHGEGEVLDTQTGVRSGNGQVRITPFAAAEASLSDFEDCTFDVATLDDPVSAGLWTSDPPTEPRSVCVLAEGQGVRVTLNDPPE